MFVCSLNFIRRFASRKFVDLGVQMKQLNDQRQFKKSIALFDAHIDQHQNTFAISQALKACIELGDFNRGIKIHQNFPSSLIKNDFIQISLIRLYMKSGNVLKAKEIFHKSEKNSSYIYVAMINGLIDNNQAQEAFHLYQQIDIPTDQYLIGSLFKICTHLCDAQSLEFGKNVLNSLPIECQDNVLLLNSALQMLVKRGDMIFAERIFAQMKKNLFTYSIMMNGFISNGMPEKAIDLFGRVQKADEVLYKIYFNACGLLEASKGLILGKRMFAQMPIKYHQSNDVLIRVFDMFVKCNDLQSAESLFSRLQKNVISYGSLMKMYNNNDQPEKTIELFKQMQTDKIGSNDIIFLLLINACAQIGDLSMCLWAVSYLSPSAFDNLYILHSLIDMWGKVGSIEKAKEIFQKIAQPDEICLSAMINAYALNGMGIECVELFRQVPADILDETMYVTVLNGCSHSGLINEAREIFEKIPLEKRTVKIYTAMIDGLSRSYEFDEAEKLITEFEQSNSPSDPMYMAILSGARNQKNPSLSQKYFDRIKQLFPKVKDLLLSATVLLANTYASAGNSEKASELRMKIGQMGVKKKVGLSRTVVNGEIVQFCAHDRSHPQSAEIYKELERLMEELIDHGHKSDSSWITRTTDFDEKFDSILCGHSERLAIAFNLIQRPVPSTIQVTKNLRVCGDCHKATKLIARIRRCHIIVRDANRIHHFYPNGQCSCQDHF